MDMQDSLEAANHARERLTHQLEQVVEGAESLLRRAREEGGDKIEDMRDGLERQLRHARTELEHTRRVTLREVRRAGRQIDHAVHEHPYTAIGVGAAVGTCVGVLVGMMLARR